MSGIPEEDAWIAPRHDPFDAPDAEDGAVRKTEIREREFRSREGPWAVRKTEIRECEFRSREGPGADTRERVLEGGEDAGDGDAERVREELGLDELSERTKRTSGRFAAIRRRASCNAFATKPFPIR